MSDESLLTKEIAEQFLADPDSVNLSEFTAIEDAAAEMLLEHDGELSLDGLSHVKALFEKQSGAGVRDDVSEDDDWDDESDESDEDEDEVEYVDDDPRPERPDPSGTVTNSIGMKLVPIPAGTFLMGDPEDGDAVQVTLSQNFYLGMTQVTQAQYMRVMGENPSWFQGDTVKGRDSSEFPVENVSWEDAMEFCQKLSELPEEKAAGRVYRLPTEAEWEYACRAGSKTAYSFGKSSEKLGDYAWFSQNSNDRPHPVALKKPNAWGLYDMHGNVWEWCSDWYGDYPEGAVTDPSGPEEGSVRVYRGGSWLNGAASCRSANRFGAAPGYRNNFNGFRLALSSSGILK
jgi:formylglycine-generating enzyme required for sulfatase activity